MPSFDPPSIKPNAAPDFTDSSGCAKWLQSLPLINVGPSHVRLLGQLDELNAYNVARAGELRAKGALQEIFHPPRPARQAGARDLRQRVRALGRALIRISTLSE